MKSSWLKAVLYLAVLVAAQRLSPEEPVDPWGLLNPKKIVSLILALSIIHFAGALLMRLMGHRSSALLTGLLGGFVSSTATTVGVAKKSQTLDDEATRIESLSYLSATLAMLVEALVLVFIGSSHPPPTVYLIFATPIAVTFGLLVYSYRKIPVPKATPLEVPPLTLMPILKLTAFIVAILGLSKILQQTLGQQGLMLLTFLVSLFEIHGSIIANIQLYEYETIGPSVLTVLLTLSVLASYVSKIFLVYTLGNDCLKKTVRNWTLLIVSTFLLAAGALYLTSKWNGDSRGTQTAVFDGQKNPT